MQWRKLDATVQVGEAAGPLVLAADADSRAGQRGGADGRPAAPQHRHVPGHLNGTPLHGH